MHPATILIKKEKLKFIARESGITTIDSCYISLELELERPDWGLICGVFYPSHIEQEIMSQKETLEQIAHRLEIWCVLVRSSDVIDSLKRKAILTKKIEDMKHYLDIQFILSSHESWRTIY